MNATRQEVYVSVDIEADGPIPGPHSMLSLASAAFLPDKTLVSTFSVNLETLPGAGADPRTMEWWDQFPEAWQASRSDPQPPATAMRKAPFFKTGKSYLPKRWFEERPHTHVALDDALEQGVMFCNMLRENLDGKP